MVVFLVQINIIQNKHRKQIITLLVSVGDLCILQGLFTEIQNLSTVNRKELQLMSK